MLTRVPCYCCCCRACPAAAAANEGGRYQLVFAAVSNGKLLICKDSVGDKRCFKGAKKEALAAVNSFKLA